MANSGIQFVFDVNLNGENGFLRGKKKYVLLIMIIFVAFYNQIILKTMSLSSIAARSQTTKVKDVQQQQQQKLDNIDDEIIRILNITLTTTKEGNNYDDDHNNKLLLLRNNYFFRAWFDLFDGTDDNNNDISKKEFPGANSIESFKVLQTYIRQHSNGQLQQEWDNCQKALLDDDSSSLMRSNNSSNYNKSNNNSSNIIISPPSSSSCDAINNRKFIVGMWSCPIESGNRIHSFMNALLWSILTNRTLLARYDSVDTCLEYHHYGGGEEEEEKTKKTIMDECTTQNMYSHPSYCKNVLHLSPWVPQFDYWNNTFLKILSPTKQIVKAEIVQNNNVKPDRLTMPYDNPSNPRILRTGDQYLPDFLQILRGGTGNNDNTGKKKNRHLSLPSNLERLDKLGEFGPYFVYGMMFESLFTIDLSLLPPKPSSQSKNVSANNDNDNDNVVQTYFLHSRHATNNDKYTWPEEKCIEGFERVTPNEKPCLFYLMSDRIVALEILENFILNRTHCNVIKVENRTTGKSFLSEHGPFAGRGYWEDVALSSQARDGMISFHMNRRDLVRTSSALIREIIEFRRILEIGKKVVVVNTTTTTTTTTQFQIPQFLECRSPWIKEKNIGIEI